MDRTAALTRSDRTLVERVSTLAGSEDRLSGPSGATVPTKVPPEHPAQDGYMRVSPVQVMYRAEDYYRRLTKRYIGVSIALFIVISVAIFIFRK